MFAFNFFIFAYSIERYHIRGGFNNACASLDILLKLNVSYCRLEASSAHDFALNATRPCYMLGRQTFLGRLQRWLKPSAATALISARDEKCSRYPLAKFSSGVFSFLARR